MTMIRLLADENVAGQKVRRLKESGFETIAPTRHFALLASRETLTKRLSGRGAEPWPFEQIDRCVSALAKPEFAVHLDAERSVEELTDEVSKFVAA